MNEADNRMQGHTIAPDVLAEWMSAFARYTQPNRPQVALDLGSGAGRFTPALAEEFQGPAYGVEPSRRMRELAQRYSAHPRVTYLDGGAERVPLPDGSCDVALMFLVLHHVTNKPAAAAELSRVLKPGGRLLIRTPLLERSSDPLLYKYFPSAREIEARLCPTLEEIERTFGAVGFGVIDATQVPHRLADNLAEYVAQLKRRGLTMFKYLSEEEITAGFAMLDVDGAAETTPQAVVQHFDLVILSR